MVVVGLKATCMDVAGVGVAFMGDMGVTCIGVVA